MDAMSINSKPHALLPEDTTRERNAAATRRLDKTRSAPAAGYDSGPIATSGEHLTSSSQPHSPSISVPVSSSVIAPSSASLTLPNPPPPSSRPPSSRRSTPAAFFTRPVRGNSNGSTSGTSFPPLFFRPSNNTTPETSLVGASGKSIPLGDGTVADRTSALRELNTNYPSPVLRHGYAKSTGAKNTTYSQPVIVRTYSGPSPSPSSSAHYRRPSSGSRHTNRVGGLGQPPSTSVPSLSRVGDSSVHGSNHAPGIGEGAKDSLFSMACTKVKKGLMPWQWSMSGSRHPQDDEAKLPPLEAFTYKGFLADLQTNTSIRSDLDRIAEICARSRYSLSNQYDAHVAPHGSGAAFISGMGGQSSYRTRGRKKSNSSPGGPTLQVVPSDDDETGTRGQRRRRGGAGGGRRRSAAYGTLETIMSSSRSSEEGKSKKMSAAEIAEEVRSRAAQKAVEAAEESDSKPSSGRERKKQHNSGVKGSAQGSMKTQAPKLSSTTSRRSGKHSQQRQKPASFAHAMIDSNRQQSAPDRDSKSTTTPTVALLSDPALPQTSNNLLEIRTAPEAANPSNGDEGFSIPVDNMEGLAPIDDEALEEAEAEASGFLSGLGNWIPWVASTGTNDSFVAGHQSQSTGRLSPSHAEGSLRELLKTANSSRPNKGKAVDRQH